MRLSLSSLPQLFSEDIFQSNMFSTCDAGEEEEEAMRRCSVKAGQSSIIFIPAFSFEETVCELTTLRQDDGTRAAWPQTTAAR